MLPELQNGFGHCIIPKNTLLYHGTKNLKIKDCMFFGLDFWLPTVFHDTIQVWRARTNIEVIFLCESVDGRSWTESAIPRLYNLVFPDERNDILEDLDIKHFDHQRRDKFIAELMSRYKLNGWFSSMEENMELEVCLFGKDFIQANLELVDTKAEDDTTYYKSSLREMEVYPTKAFYERSYTLLQRGYGGPIDKNLYWKKYKRWNNLLINEFVKTKQDILRNVERNYTLRVKLQI